MGARPAIVLGSLAVIAGMMFAAEPAQASGAGAMRVFHPLGSATRFVRLESDVVVDGIAGTASALYDTRTGRFIERVEAGPASFGDGFDGSRRWFSDVTGLPLVDDTLDGILDARVWAHLFGRSGPTGLRVTQLPPRGQRSRLRLRYASLTGPVDLTLQSKTGLIEAVDDFAGAVPQYRHFAEYRRVGDVMIPFSWIVGTQFSTVRYTVRSARPVAVVSRFAFVPPPAPRDTWLDGVTAVPMDLSNEQLVIPIRIDDGPVLHVLLDSGSSNFLSPRAARRLGLAVTGEAKSGGVGAGVVREQYTVAARLNIGRAEMRNIPFAVLNDGAETDGAIGCEVFQRFVVRFNFRAGIVQFARSLRELGTQGTPLVIRTGSCQPELDGALDGIPGVAAIDTGSAIGVDVTSPFVRRHRLIKHYWAWRSIRGGGIGGGTHGLAARAQTLELGPFALHDVDVSLSIMQAGAFTDPTEMANLGLPVLSRFTMTLDYRTHRVWLEPRMSLFGIPLEDD